MNAESILSSISPPKDALRSSDLLISAGQEIKFLEHAIDACPGTRLGLLVGAKLHSSSFGVLGMAMMCCHDLQSALQFVGRYIMLTYSHFQWTVDTESSNAFIVGTDIHGYEGDVLQYLSERDLAASVTYVSDALGQPLRPSQISFPYSQPCPIRIYEDFFKCEVLFDQKQLALCFDAELLAAKLPQRNQRTFHTLEVLCAEEMREIRKVRSFAKLVEMHLRSDEGAFRTLNQVASILNLDPRTIRRRLTSEETSFQSILDTNRRNRAIDLLKNSQDSLTQISESLGFSEPAAFFHAFKRWTGKNPNSFR